MNNDNYFKKYEYIYRVYIEIRMKDELKSIKSKNGCFYLLRKKLIKK